MLQLYTSTDTHRAVPITERGRPVPLMKRYTVVQSQQVARERINEGVFDPEKTVELDIESEIGHISLLHFTVTYADSDVIIGISERRETIRIHFPDQETTVVQLPN